MELPEEKRGNEPAGATGGRLFLQPLSIAIVAVVVAALFFVMAMFDVRRVEHTLLNVLETKAVAIIQGVEHLAELRLDRFQAIAENRPYSALDPSALDHLFSAQEALAEELIAVAADLDRRAASTGPMTVEELRAVQRAESLVAIALLDAAGDAAITGGPLPEGMAARIGSLLQPHEEIAVNLFSREPGGIGYIGLRRKAGAGAVFIFIDREGIRQWGFRIALRQAAEEGGWRQGVDYLTLIDSQGRTIAHFGAPPPSAADDVEGLAAGGGRIRRFVRETATILEVAEPLRLQERVVGEARVGLDTGSVDELLAENRRHIFLSMGLMIGLGLLAMGFLYTNQNRHLRRIQELRNRLQQTERLSAMGRLAAGVAHEVRNPLNAVSLAVQRIQREYAPQPAESGGEFHTLIRTVRREIARLDATIEEFLSLARPGRLDLRPMAVADLLKSILLLVRAEAEARGIRIETAWEEPAASAVIDENRMRQAVLNLIKNAFEAIEGAGTLRIAVKNRPRNRVVIAITDTGAGIPAGAQDRMFTPDYTTKEKGVGLGLAIALQIVRAHDGEMRVKSEPGRGTTFEILLPRKGE